MKFSKALITFLCVILLSGCAAPKYSEDFKNTKSEEYIAAAQEWFTENIPDATSISYRLYINAYVTDLVCGRFTYEDVSRYYAWNATSQELYVNVTKHGITMNDAELILKDIINDYFDDPSIEVSVSAMRWSVPCKNFSYTATTGNYDLDDMLSGDASPATNEVEYEVKSADSISAYSYLEWDMSYGNVYTYVDDLLCGRVDGETNITLDIDYDDYDSIEHEIDGQYCMKAYPGIQKITFTVDDGNDKTVDDFYSMVRNSDMSIDVVRHYMDVDSKGQEKWKVEHLNTDDIRTVSRD
ncbi:hypothetical protein J6A31_04710 [bacterium]|nr:hypothetical protein [bacterium]